MKFRLRPSSLEPCSPTNSTPSNLAQLAATIANFTQMAGEDDSHVLMLTPSTRIKLTSRVRVAWGNRVAYVELQYQVAASDQWRTVS